MRTTVAFLIAASMLIGRTELHELVRLPHFLHHLVEHQDRDPRMSIVDFIVLHYFSGDVRDADHDRDQRLPFRSHDRDVAFHAVPDLFHAPIPCVAIMHQPVLLLSDRHEVNLRIGTRTDVWQPPKRA